MTTTITTILQQQQIVTNSNLKSVQGTHMKVMHDEHDKNQVEIHNEFYAKYSFKCGSIKLINNVKFSYFMTFPNSGELEVQFISELGSTSFEVEADKPVINIEGKI